MKNMHYFGYLAHIQMLIIKLFAHDNINVT